MRLSIFAKVFGYTEETKEFEAECMHAVVHRCSATREFPGLVTVLRCDRYEHDGNPWHVALHAGHRYTWGLAQEHVRPVRPEEEIP